MRRCSFRLPPPKVIGYIAVFVHFAAHSVLTGLIIVSDGSPTITAYSTDGNDTSVVEEATRLALHNHNATLYSSVRSEKLDFDRWIRFQIAYYICAAVGIAGISSNSRAFKLVFWVAKLVALIFWMRVLKLELSHGNKMSFAAGWSLAMIPITFVTAALLIWEDSVTRRSDRAHLSYWNTRDRIVPYFGARSVSSTCSCSVVGVACSCSPTAQCTMNRKSINCHSRPTITPISHESINPADVYNTSIDKCNCGNETSDCVCNQSHV